MPTAGVFSQDQALSPAESLSDFTSLNSCRTWQVQSCRPGRTGQLPFLDLEGQAPVNPMETGDGASSRHISPAGRVRPPPRAFTASRSFALQISNFGMEGQVPRGQITGECRQGIVGRVPPHGVPHTGPGRLATKLSSMSSDIESYLREICIVSSMENTGQPCFAGSVGVAVILKCLAP